jgi:hypothetical protein
MSEWSPPSVPRELVFVVLLGYVLLASYGLVIVGQLLLFGVLPGILLVTVYFFWKVLALVEAIADALQRIANQLEQE